MDNGIYKKAIQAVTGLQIGFTEDWVVREGDEWRSLTVLEVEAATVEYEKLFRENAVPKTVSKVQAMKALKAAQLWESFKTALASDVDTQDEWELALELQREHPFVIGLASVLALSEPQLDELFIQAATL